MPKPKYTHTLSFPFQVETDEEYPDRLASGEVLSALVNEATELHIQGNLVRVLADTADTEES